MLWKHSAKMALKVLKRRPFFTFISLFAIGFTLMVLTSAAAMFETLRHPSGPERENARMLFLDRGIFENQARTRQYSGGIGFQIMEHYVRKMETPERITVYARNQEIDMFTQGAKLSLTRKSVDANFWKVFQFEFTEGHGFAEDAERLAAPVAVINQATAEKLFPGENAIGQSFTMEERQLKVVGVVKNVSPLERNSFADVWVPITFNRSSAFMEAQRGNLNATLLATTPAGIEPMRQELEALAKTVQVIGDPELEVCQLIGFTSAQQLARPLTGLDESNLPQMTRFNLIIGGTVLLFMLLPAINLININVSRSMERVGEVAVRKAFGATSAKMVLQFGIENLILTLIGGILGLIGALALMRTLEQMQLIPHAQFHFNLTLFLQLLGFCFLFALMSGIYPAWRISKINPATALHGGGR